MAFAKLAGMDAVIARSRHGAVPSGKGASAVTLAVPSGWSTGAPSRRSAAEAPFASTTVAMSTTDSATFARDASIDAVARTPVAAEPSAIGSATTLPSAGSTAVASARRSTIPPAAETTVPIASVGTAISCAFVLPISTGTTSAGAAASTPSTDAASATIAGVAAAGSRSTLRSAPARSAAESVTVAVQVELYAEAKTACATVSATSSTATA